MTTTSKLGLARYFLPAYLGFAILSGKAMADWLRWTRVHAAVRIVPPFIILAVSFMYSLAVDLEMKHDTRIRAEEWMKQNIAPGESAACLYPPMYGPRLHDVSFNYHLLEKKGRKQVSIAHFKQLHPQPEYVVISEKAYSQVEPSLRESLLDGSLGYHTLIDFRPRYLSKESILGAAGYALGFDGFLSPRIVVLEKR